MSAWTQQAACRDERTDRLVKADVLNAGQSIYGVAESLFHEGKLAMWITAPGAKWYA